MGKKSRDKGNRVERLIVKAIIAHGLDAQRVPLSGAALGRFSGDILTTVAGENWTGECKARARGFAQLYDWLGEHEFLVVKADHKPPLVVLPLEQAARIAALAGKAVE